MTNTIIIVIVAAIVISIIATFFVARRITRPVNELKIAADKISKGDTSVDIKVRSGDEIGELAESFGRMLASMKFMLEDDETAPTE